MIEVVMAIIAISGSAIMKTELQQQIKGGENPE